MPPAVVTDLKKNIYTTTLGAQSFMNINTGVPHFVQEHPKGFKYLQLKEMANEVRNHKEVQPAGTNVTFFAVEGPGKVQAVTYERGVEDFTSACGTGAVAAALSYSLGNSKIKSVEVEMPGGVLKVSFELGFDCPQLIGEVTFIGEFQVNLEVLKCKD
jgi:diaminopimelate epimerase